VGSGEVYKLLGNMIATLQEKDIYSHAQDSLLEKSIVWNQEWKNTYDLDLKGNEEEL
jgi:hypothetical protein